MAAEQLARAVARATPVQLAQAQAELAMRDANRALPAPSAIPFAAPSILRAIRGALSPAPASSSSPHVVSGHKALLTTVVLALLTRLPRPRPTVRAWATTHVLPRVQAARALLARN
jgi:hypothetical protein